jgi:hypothetical protein
MNIKLSDIQVKRLFEQFELNPGPRILKIFKVLDEEKKNHKRKKELLDSVKSYLPYVGIPEGYELYILELFLLNYRKDGDYSGLNENNFIDPRKLRGKWTPNTKAYLYSKAQMPFKGSNLEGYWTKDSNGKPVYVVMSYGWYPIYIFRDGIWYEAINSYSSSTGRQMSNVNPVEWSEELNDKVYRLTQNEMNMVLRGSSHEDVIKNKLIQIKKQEPELKSKRVVSHSTYSWYDDNEQGRPQVKIKYKINSVDIVDDVAVVNVDIYDVVKRDGNKSIDTPENYLKGELPNITPKYIEDMLERKIKYRFKEFIGPRFTYHDELKDIHKFKLKFNHLKK